MLIFINEFDCRTFSVHCWSWLKPVFFGYCHFFSNSWLPECSLLWSADRAELQRGCVGEAVHGERSSGPFQSDVVMAGTAEGSCHQQRGCESPQWEERKPTERPRLSGKGSCIESSGLEYPLQISHNIIYMVSHGFVSAGCLVWCTVTLQVVKGLHDYGINHKSTTDKFWVSKNMFSYLCFQSCCQSFSLFLFYKIFFYPHTVSCHVIVLPNSAVQIQNYKQ